MIHYSIEIKNQLGIHTRSGAKLVDTAKRFESKIEILFRDSLVNCKSIMGVITLGAQKGDTILLIIQGSDEKDALNALETLINNKFGEN